MPQKLFEMAEVDENVIAIIADFQEEMPLVDHRIAEDVKLQLFCCASLYSFGYKRGCICLTDRCSLLVYYSGIVTSGYVKVNLWPFGCVKCRRTEVRPMAPLLLEPYFLSPHNGKPREANCTRI